MIGELNGIRREQKVVWVYFTCYSQCSVRSAEKYFSLCTIKRATSICKPMSRMGGLVGGGGGVGGQLLMLCPNLLKSQIPMSRVGGGGGGGLVVNF